MSVKEEGLRGDNHAVIEKIVVLMILLVKFLTLQNLQ